MPIFTVALFRKGAQTSSILREVYGRTAHDAAEIAAGRRLEPTGEPGLRVAQVWLPDEPEKRLDFYAPLLPAKPKRRTSPRTQRSARRMERE
jgi:hypothetical protein